MGVMRETKVLICKDLVHTPYVFKYLEISIQHCTITNQLNDKEINIVFTHIVDFFFGLGLFINAMLFVPQGIRLFKEKQSKDLSLITFVGFCITQLLAIIYGWLHKDYILMVGYLLALTTCGAVTILIAIYRTRSVA